MRKIAIIGAGSKQGLAYFNALRSRSDAQVVACVVNRSVPKELQRSGAPFITGGDFEPILSHCDTALVSLPHHLHQEVTRCLLQAGICVIKEKPLALSSDEALELQRLAKKKSLPPVFTTVQRSCHPFLLEAQRWLSRLGSIRRFSYRYTFALPSKTTGWRSERAKSGGGVLIDMGYHSVDLIQLFFGRPLAAKATFDHAYTETRAERLEESAEIQFTYQGLSGSLYLDRHAKENTESFHIEGERGELLIKPDRYEVRLDAALTTQLNVLSKEQQIHALFDRCFHGEADALERDFQRHLDTVSLIESLYH